MGDAEKMIVVLTGAQKNAGDYLIGDRAKKLLHKYVDKDIVEFSRFEELGDKLEIVNSSKALFLCGGPAYSSNVYPAIYPLVADLTKIKVPIIPFGVGWCGKPMHTPDNFSFTEESIFFLQSIHKKIKNSSCRDVITEKILHNHGLDNVIMTGCPVWYDLDCIGKKYKPPSEVKRVVVSTPDDPRLVFQFLKLVRLVKWTFNSAEINVVFHRGIYPDHATSLKSSLIYILMALVSKLFGTKVKDVSYGIEKMDFYNDCDFHIGYRVHAHLLFLSKRKPSLLINEDGRGLGMVKSMDLPIFNRDDKNINKKIEIQLDMLIKENFSSFNSVFQYIDKNFNEMKRFLNNISIE